MHIVMSAQSSGERLPIRIDKETKQVGRAVARLRGAGTLSGLVKSLLKEAINDERLRRPDLLDDEIRKLAKADELKRLIAVKSPANESERKNVRKKPHPRLPRVRRRGNVEYLPTIQWREVTLPSWARQSDQFVLREVCGDSLSAVGIQDGDYVLIYLTDFVGEGDLIAAATPDGCLVKFLSYTPDGSIRLSGSDNIPRVFPAKSVHIEGRIVR